jgi:hypothetical protein
MAAGNASSSGGNQEPVKTVTVLKSATTIEWVHVGTLTEIEQSGWVEAFGNALERAQDQQSCDAFDRDLTAQE